MVMRTSWYVEEPPWRPTRPCSGSIVLPRGSTPPERGDRAPDAGGLRPPHRSIRPQHHLYLDRLRVCVEYHAERFGEEGRPIPPARVIERLEQGDLGTVKVRANLLRDVVLAQALQLGEPRAAEVFETEFMPVVRSIARHLGGDRAVDAVENFAAELVLPREGREPRIATYQGRTTLGHWLGPVVANAWRTELRRRKPDCADPLRARRPGCRRWCQLQPAADDDDRDWIDVTSCSGRSSWPSGRLLDPEDRLLLQMLMLDGVPQKDLARSLGLNSGTITRRRQRAVETILERHSHARGPVSAAATGGGLPGARPGRRRPRAAPRAGRRPGVRPATRRLSPS